LITIVLTYRNRDTPILEKCLKSLDNQTQKTFKVVLVNYGSNELYTNAIKNIESDYEFLSVMHCNTQGQLWCKSKAINMVLKHCDTPYFFVGDVDMMYHPQCIEKLESLKQHTASYFKVGFLSKEESALNKAFEAYDINFTSDEAATGITLFKTDILHSINGYDEFYHGWGSEDTDVHVRLRNAGHTIFYYDATILMLHQWHKKAYRTKDSLEPFHSHLERVNQAYLQFAESSRKIKANTNYNWAHYSESDYQVLKQVDQEFKCTNKQASVKGFIHSVLYSKQDTVIKLIVSEDLEYKSVKQLVKQKMGKKTIAFMPMEAVNDIILESIITKLRHCAYNYKFDRKINQITLTIKL